MSRKHMGSSIDDFLKQEGIFEESQAQAVKEVVEGKHDEVPEQAFYLQGTIEHVFERAEQMKKA